MNHTISAQPVTTQRKVTFRTLFQLLNRVDVLTLCYLIGIGFLLALSPNPVTKRGQLLLAHSGFVVMVFVLAYLRPKKIPVLHFLSHWYPLGLSGFFFEEIHHIVHILQPGWRDQVIINFDYAMFGAHATVWAEKYISFALTELLNFAYFLYWPLIPALALLLWLRQRQLFPEFVFALCLSYLFCYVVFICFPIEGPYHTLRHLQTVHEMPGGIFTHLVELVEKHGRIHGGAFPSAHVAGSVVAMFAAFRYSRPLGILVLLIVIGVCAATVYGRYHYAADIWGGIFVAALGYYLTRRLPSVHRSDAITVSTLNLLP